MQYSVYNNTITQMLRMLSHAQNWLEKAISYAEEQNIDQNTLAAYRLRPDMLPLTKQIQIACDVSKGCAGRLSGQDAPSHEDNEATLSQLIERIEKTQAFLKEITPEQFEGAETKDLEIKLPKMTLSFVGSDYVNQFVLPNLYFHLSTAYAILRYAGVPLGKMDFLGQIGQPAQ